MKQEHRLVAELYRHLAPFIDMGEQIFVSLDGQAAMVGVINGTFADSALPDLWFTLVGARTPTLIEAKTVDTDGRVLLMQSQLNAWRTKGTGSHKPKYWVAVNREFDQFFFWTQTEFLSRLDNTNAKSSTVTLLLPDARRLFASVNELALHVLRQEEDRAIS